jgi:protein SCO1/2
VSTKKFGLLLSLLLMALVLGCNKSSQNTTQSSSSNQTTTKRYQFKGKVVSIDERGKMANIDSEAIPGFMDAMTMPYQVKPENELDRLHPGDSITANLVVQDENAWLENISIASRASSEGKK